MKKTKRILAWILSLAMVVTMTPTVAFGATDNVNGTTTLSADVYEPVSATKSGDGPNDGDTVIIVDSDFAPNMAVDNSQKSGNSAPSGTSVASNTSSGKLYYGTGSADSAKLTWSVEKNGSEYSLKSTAFNGYLYSFVKGVDYMFTVAAKSGSSGSNWSKDLYYGNGSNYKQFYGKIGLLNNNLYYGKEDNVSAFHGQNGRPHNITFYKKNATPITANVTNTNTFTYDGSVKLPEVTTITPANDDLVIKYSVDSGKTWSTAAKAKTNNDFPKNVCTKTSVKVGLFVGDTLLDSCDTTVTITKNANNPLKLNSNITSPYQIEQGGSPTSLSSLISNIDLSYTDYEFVVKNNGTGVSKGTFSSAEAMNQNMTSWEPGEYAITIKNKNGNYDDIQLIVVVSDGKTVTSPTNTAYTTDSDDISKLTSDSNVLFASKAPAATATKTNLSSNSELVVRHASNKAANGTSCEDKISSSGEANQFAVKVANPTATEFLYVQWSDGVSDKIASVELDPTKNTYYASDFGLTFLTEDCKIWIEKDIAGTIYAKNVPFKKTVYDDSNKIFDSNDDATLISKKLMIESGVEYGDSGNELQDFSKLTNDDRTLGNKVKSIYIKMFEDLTSLFSSVGYLTDAENNSFQKALEVLQASLDDNEKLGTTVNLNLYVSDGTGSYYVKNAKLSEAISVDIPYKGAKKGSQYPVYHWNGSGFDPKITGTSTKNGTVTVQATDFSPYVIIDTVKYNTVEFEKGSEGVNFLYEGSYNGSALVKASETNFNFKVVLAKGYSNLSVYDNSALITGSNLEQKSDGSTVYSYSINMNDKNHRILAAAQKTSKYTLNYVLNGGNWSEANSKEYTDGDTVTVTSVVPTKTDYVFDGWYNSVTGNVISAGDTFKITQDTYLTAQWKKAEYTVNYRNGIAFSSYNSIITGSYPKTEYYANGDTVTVPANPGGLDLTIDYNIGYAFDSWKDQFGNVYKFGETFKITTNTTLVPNWKNGVVVDYYLFYKNSSGGYDSLSINDVLKNKTYLAGATINLPSEIDAINIELKLKNSFALSPYYKIKGWIIDTDDYAYNDAGEEKASFGQNFVVKDYGSTDGRVVVKADIGYSITYNHNADGNGGGTLKSGSVPVDNNYYSFGEIATVSGNINGMKLSDESNKFSGWNTNAAGTGTSFAAGQQIPQKDLYLGFKLYAQWKSGYSLTYDANGANNGSVPKDNQVYDSNSTATVLGNTGSLSMKDKVFGGWFIDKNNNKVYDKATDGNLYKAGYKLTITTDTVLLANWADDDYVVKYVSTTGSDLTGAATATCIANASYKVNYDFSKFYDSTSYKFAGWLSSADGKLYENGQSFNMPSKNVTLTAVLYSIKKYAVIFDENDAAGTVPTKLNLEAGKTVTLPTTTSLVKAGYSFNGWNTMKDGSGDNYALGSKFVVPEENTVLYAQWSADTFKVTYKKAGTETGEVPIDENAYLKNSAVTVLGNTGSLEKKGYFFDGWTDGVNTYKAGAQFNITTDTTLIAVWTQGYKVTYKNGKVDSGVLPKDDTLYEKDALVTVAENTGNLSKEGYTFVGWKNDIDNKVYVPGAQFNITTNTTLTAKWVQGYQVKYDANGGIIGKAPVDNNYYQSGTVINVPGNINGMVNGTKAFAGWNTNAAGTGTDFVVGAQLEITTNTTLYAKWVQGYKLTYDANGANDGSVPSDNTFYVKGATAIVLGNTGSLSMKDKVFGGWFVDKNNNKIYDKATDGNLYKAGDKLTITTDTVLLANWVDNIYNIKYVFVDGKDITNSDKDGNYPTATCLADKAYKVNYSYNGKYTTTKYSFAGWLSSADNKIYQNGQSFNMPSKDVTLTAVLYSIKKYDVIFDANDAVGTVPTKLNLEAGKTVTLPTTTSLVKAGYSFNGWNTMKDGSGDNYAIGSTFIVPENNTVLYAQWSADTFKVTYKKAGTETGEVPMDENAYLKNSAVTVLGNTGSLVNKGYFFDGWTDGVNTYKAGAQFNITTDTTLTAVWTQGYNVTYKKGGADSGVLPKDDTLYEKGALVTAAENTGKLSKEGCTFVGWKNNSDNKVYVPGAQFKITTDTILTAQWLQGYKLTYEANGANGGSVPSDNTFYVKNATATVLGNTGNLSMEDKVFAGWFEDSNGNKKYDENIETLYNAGDKLTITADTVLYANWVNNNFKIKYVDVNGKDIAVTDTNGCKPTAKCLAGEPFKVNYIYTYDKNDYTFGGWRNSYDGKLYQIGQSFNMPTEDVDLTAVIYSIVKYDLIFDGNGATGISIAKMKMPSNSIVTLPTATTLTKDGYRFMGWNTKKDGSGVNYEAGSSFVFPEENTVLYAQWAKEYTVKFDLGEGLNQNGNIAIADQIVIAGEKLKPVGKINDFTIKTGEKDKDYYFAGWLNQNGTAWSFEYDVVNEGWFDKNGVMTLRANWSTTQHYNIVFNDNLDSPLDDYVTINDERQYDANKDFTDTYKVENVAVNSSLTKEQTPEFERVNYTFDGWYLDKACSDKYEFEPSENIEANKLDYFVAGSDKTVTVYAKWTADFDSTDDITIDGNSLDSTGTYNTYYSDWAEAYHVRNIIFKDPVYRNFYISEGELPDGLHLNQRTGEIYGIPEKTGEFNFTLVVLNDEEVQISEPKEFTITIKPNTLNIDHTELTYSKTYGNADPVDLLKNSIAFPTKTNLSVSLKEVGSNYVGLQLFDNSNAMNVNYNYKNNNDARIAKADSFAAAETSKELNDTLKYARDLKVVTIANEKTDEFALDFHRVQGENAGKYKLYMNKDNDVTLKSAGNVKGSAAIEKLGYTIAIPEDFQDTTDISAAEKYVFTINKANLTIGMSGYQKNKTYGENDPAYYSTYTNVAVGNATSIVKSDVNNKVIVNFEGTGKANLTDVLTIKLQRKAGEDFGDYRYFIANSDSEGNNADIDGINGNYNVIVTDNLKNAAGNNNKLTINKRDTTFSFSNTYTYGDIKPLDTVSGSFASKALANNSAIGVVDSATATVKDNAKSSAGMLKAGTYPTAADILKIDVANNASEIQTASINTTDDYNITKSYAITVYAKPLALDVRTVNIPKFTNATAQNIFDLVGLVEYKGNGGIIENDQVALNITGYVINGISYTNAIDAANAIKLINSDVSVVITYNGLIGSDAANYSITGDYVTATIHPVSEVVGGGGDSEKTISIKCKVGDNGSISPLPDKSNCITVSKGDNKTIKVVPDKGYEVADVVVDGKSVGAVSEYIFTKITSERSIAVTFKKSSSYVNPYSQAYKTCAKNKACLMNGYSDIDSEGWYHDGIHYCLENGFMNGVDKNIFAPDGTTTRGMLVTILYRMEGSPNVSGSNPFKDVKADDWFYDAVLWANQNGIVKGYNSNTFGPNNNITREQVASIFARFTEYKGIEVDRRGDLSKYTDVADISSWALDDVRWAVSERIMNGYTEKTIAPLMNATRAQIATFIMRLCENVL